MNMLNDELDLDLDFNVDVDDPTIIDDSDYNEINVSTREIIVHDNNKLLGVASDEKVTRINFRCDNQLSTVFDTCNCNIYINYKNANGELNSYLVDDVTITDNYTYFSWLLSRHVTEAPGTVQYIVCVKRSDGTNTTNEWNTKVATGTVIANDIEPVKEIEEQNADVIEQILARIDILENGSGSSVSLGITGAEEFADVRIKTVDETGKPTSWETYNLNDEIDHYVDHNAVLMYGDKISSLKNDAGYITEAPTKVSELENDSGFLTEHQSLAEYAKKTEIPTVPTKVSELENDSGYAKKTDIPAVPAVPTKVSQLENDSGFLTEHQSLAEYAKKTEVPTKTSELQNDSGYLTEHQSLAEYAKKTEIPTKTSELQNDSGYLTEHQSLAEYAKKTEVPTKVSQLENDSGYLTEHQSLSDYAKKTEIPTIPESLKNPNALTIKVGDTTTTYDGSEAKTVDVSADESIPSYWLTHLQTKADKIREVMEAAGRNKSAFLFYTDAHWDYGEKKAPMLLKYLYNNTPINKTIFGGDIVNSESTDRDVMKYLWEWRKQVRELPNHHSVVGNHDDGATTNNLFSTDYIYSFLLAAEETPNIVQGGDMYYYIDEPCEKTRYLYLDTAYIGINSSQTTFIKEALKTAPDNWHIVAISHIWYEPDYAQYSVRPIPIVGYGTGVESIVNLFDDYNARQDEFSSCTAKVEFCIGGHCHRDYTGRTTGGIPIILCETDSHHNRSGLTDTAGTTTESSVNAIIVNYSTEKINVIRIGRGENFEVPLHASVTPPASYTNLISTAIDTSGNVYNNSGYKAGTYINTSDGVTEVANQSYWCTGLIPITKGDVVRIKYVFNKSTYNDPNNYYYSNLCFYNADKSFNRFKYLNEFLNNNFISGDYEWSGTNFEGTLTFTFDGTSSMFNNAKYIRVSSAYLGNSANMQTSIENAVITINEEIN